MTVWNYFSLVGGLAVFLYGMLQMNKNLTAIAGNRLSKVMLNLTKGKVRGYLTGLGVTIINQSSSATTVLEAALVGAGLMTFGQSLAVTLGAELGSTFLGQLVAFPSITKLSTIIIAAGFFSTLVTKTKRRRSAAKAVLAFGLLFLGIDMMSKSLEPLRTFEPFLDLMARIDNPLLGILIGLLFTMIVQSSGATSGLTIAMAVSGTITLAEAVPINMGAAIGTCITAVLGSMALNREAKRAAYIHILFQTIGVILVYILLQIPFRGDRLWLFLVKEFTRRVLGTESLARQIAMAHTFMSVVNHLFIVPLLPFVVKFFNAIYPPKDIEEPFGVKYINDTLIDSPDLALKAAKKEILRGVEMAKEMFDESIAMFETRNIQKLREIGSTEEKVDILRNEIIPFLTKVAARELTDEESVTEVTYLYITNEFESIGDVIDKNVLALAQKLIESNHQFSADGAQDIKRLYEEISRNFDSIVEVIKRGDLKLAQEVTLTGGTVRKLETDLRERHFKRLQDGLKETVKTSSVHLDLLDNLKRVNDHIVYMAYTVLGRI
jgi:phosphate:Na+ symporter